VLQDLRYYHFALTRHIH